MEEEPLFADRYRMQKRVGGGGMAEVWAAYDEQAKRRVALKIIQLQEEGEEDLTLARFRREAELSKQLRAKSFPEVYDHGIVGDRAYLSMELLEGENLFERLRRQGRMTPAECVAMVRGIAGALRLAHALQVVHRDLKPGNIFFATKTPTASGVQCARANEEVVKLLDLGIAKDTWVQSRLTQPGTIVGSTFYMSPEQIQSGRDVDCRSDLWSLGVLLYRALTGQRPFTGHPVDVMASILFDDHRPPSTVQPAFVPAVDAFFKKALHKSPEGRFQTIDEMEQAFASALELQPSLDAPIDDQIQVHDAELERTADQPTVLEPMPMLEELEEPPVLLEEPSDESAVRSVRSKTLPPFAHEPEVDVAPLVRPRTRRSRLALLLMFALVIVAIVGIDFLRRGDDASSLWRLLRRPFEG